MGNWYTNIALQGVQQSEVVSILQSLGRRAYITPPVSGWTFVYDQETDKFDLDILESLSLTLSSRLSCVALASFNADDDILWLGLYQNGQQATRYTSDRKFFEDGDEFPTLADVSTALSQLLPQQSERKKNIKILRVPHGVLGVLYFVIKSRLAYLFEIDRHMELLSALRLPHAPFFLSHEYVHKGETPEGVDRDLLLRVN